MSIAKTVIAAPAIPRWQLSLRSLLVITAMVAMVLAWLRSSNYGFRALNWLEIGAIALPFLIPPAIARIETFLSSGDLLKTLVAFAGFNVTRGFIGSLMVISCHNPRRLGEYMQESLAMGLYGAFVLPVALAVVAVVGSANPESRPNAWDYGFVLLIVGNVMLLYWFIPFALTIAWGVWWN